MARRGYSASCRVNGAVVLFVAALVVVPSACAALVDRGFESGSLAGWQTIGTVSIATSAFGAGPTEGTYQALLTNGDGSAPIETLESFIGVSAGTLSGLGNGTITDGSALKQTFTAAAGSHLSFDWDFLTDELPSSPYNDFAFVTISGLTSTLANTHASFIVSLAPFQRETGYHSFTYVTPADGTYTIAVGVVDVLDTVGSSAVLVDNFNLADSACGNGVLDFGEQCDDHNRTPGDGCDDECQIEPCHTCSGEPSACSPSPDGTSCDDEDFCNGTDTCSGGACSVHSGDPCAGGVECNNVCNEMRHTCLVAAGVPCTDDGNACTFDLCDGTGMCIHPNDDFIVCDDGVFCNGVDLCQGGTCSLHSGNPCEFTGCTTVCDETTAACGPTAAGMPCFDDGNACTLDECDGTGVCAHRPVPDGTACDDANACTRTDACQRGVCVGADPVVCAPVPCRDACDPITGTCTGQMAVIQNGCRQAGQSRFRYVNSATDTKDRVEWKWGHGAATSQADFGDPTTSANYQFCVFAETSDATTLLLGAEVPASASAWTPIGTVGYKYLDQTAAEDGISQILVRGGAAGRSKIILRGKGAGLSDPTLPLAPANGIRVQLTNESTGICWESEFPLSAIGGSINASAP